MTITITGKITDDLFDQFIGLIELHGGEFFGEYNSSKAKGDLSIGNPRKGTLESLMPFVESFCRKRNLVLIKTK